MTTPYFERNGITIYQGDCREILPTLGPVDHVITDPPYDEHTHKAARQGGTEITNGRGTLSRVVDLGFDFLSDETRAAVAGEFGRLTKRWCLVFSDVENVHRWRQDLEESGFQHIRVGSWIKEGCTPQFTGDRPAIGFETIEITHKPGKKTWNGGGTRAVWSHSIVRTQAEEGRFHTTQKPIALMRELVSLFTDPGETILDPFCGSGTTLVAAYQLGRKAIGIELEEKWCETTAKRLEREMAQGRLFQVQPEQSEQGAML